MSTTLIPTTGFSVEKHFNMNDEDKWQAVVSKNPIFDGRFVYCVKTTGIFCRPICKARLARRANVGFFDTPAEAQAAGFRSCKRCQPLLATYNPEGDKIKKACDYIDALPEDAPLPGLERLAKEAGLTKHHFHRLFKRETGFTPREYALSRRSESSSETTNSTVMTPVTPSTNSFGTPLITDDELFSLANIDPFLGDSLKDISIDDVDAFTVYFRIMDTTYGYLLVAFVKKQICKLELGSSEGELVESLQASFPALYYLHCPVELADSAEAAAFQQHIDALVEALENPSGKVLDIPISQSLQTAQAAT